MKKIDSIQAGMFVSVDLVDGTQVKRSKVTSLMSVRDCGDYDETFFIASGLIPIAIPTPHDGLSWGGGIVPSTLIVHPSWDYPAAFAVRDIEGGIYFVKDLSSKQRCDLETEHGPCELYARIVVPLEEGER